MRLGPDREPLRSRVSAQNVRDSLWLRIGAVLVVVLVLGAGSFLFMGTQVSSILSTVGSSV